MKTVVEFSSHNTELLIGRRETQCKRVPYPVVSCSYLLSVAPGRPVCGRPAPARLVRNDCLGAQLIHQSTPPPRPRGAGVSCDLREGWWKKTTSSVALSNPHCHKSLAQKTVSKMPGIWLTPAGRNKGHPPHIQY